MEHREVPDPAVCHDLHTLIDGVLGTDGDEIPGHDFLHSRLFRRPPLKDDFSGVVPFRDDSHQLLIRYHEDGSDRLLSHQVDRLIDASAWPYRPNFMPFPAQNGFNRVEHERPTHPYSD